MKNGEGATAAAMFEQILLGNEGDLNANEGKCTSIAMEFVTTPQDGLAPQEKFTH